MASIDKLLNSGEFQLTEDKKLVLGSDLQNIQRQPPLDQRPADVPKCFTQIFCCAKCGRLHNYISVPCPHCDWSPQTIEEMAASIILSNTGFDVSDLLNISREIAKGRAANDVVQNLVGSVQKRLRDPEFRQAAGQLFSLLRKDEHMNHRSIKMLRECASCGEQVLESGAEKCEKCGAEVTWPDAIRTLVCIDNLLWYFEEHVAITTKDYFSEFVCVLVLLLNNLIRKQEPPSVRDRQYCLQLLTNIRVIMDANKEFFIEMSDINKLVLHFIADHIQVGAEQYSMHTGLFLHKELEFFVKKMTDGVRL